MHPEPHERQKLERLLGGDGAGHAQHAEGAPDLVLQDDALGLEQRLPHLALVFHDLRDDADEVVDDLVLGLAERHLVGDLVEIPRGLGALAVQPAHGQVDLVHGLEHLLDLPGDDQGRQVQHDRDPHARPQIGGASRQVAELRGVRVVDALLEGIVDFVGEFERRPELEARPQALDPEMVLLVDHDADALVRRERHAARPLREGVVAADQVALHQELPFDVLHGRQVVVSHPGPERTILDGGADEPLDRGALLLGGAGQEGESGHVAGQPDAAAHDDIGLRTAAAEPLAGKHL